jgi:hypothetical protein
MILDYNHLRISPPKPPSSTYREAIIAKISHHRDICVSALREADRQCLIAKEASLEIMRLEEILKSVEMVDGVCGLHPTGKDLVVVKKE